MHDFPLHRDVEARCTCCRIIDWMTFKSPSDHMLCKACRRHQGQSVTKLQQRDFDHVYRREGHFEEFQQARAEDEVRLRNGIAAKDRELGEQRLKISDLQSVLERGVQAAASPEVEHWFADQHRRGEQGARAGVPVS